MAVGKLLWDMQSKYSRGVQIRAAVHSYQNGRALPGVPRRLHRSRVGGELQNAAGLDETCCASRSSRLEMKQVKDRAAGAWGELSPSDDRFNVVQ